MKQFVMAAAILFATVCTTAAPTAPRITPEVLNAFKAEFQDVENVQWSVKNDLFVATFEFNNQRVSALFTEEGQLEAMQRVISADQLLMPASATVQQLGKTSVISAVAEVWQNQEFFYLVKTETASHIVTYKVFTDGSTVRIQKKKK